MTDPSQTPSFAFPRTARLTCKGDFDFVFAKASRVADRYFTVLSRHQPQVDDARVGLVVSKKAAKRAVDRNRLKRLVRESFRQHRSSIGVRDFVVLPRPAAKQASNNELANSLANLWRRAMTTRTC